MNPLLSSARACQDLFDVKKTIKAVKKRDICYCGVLLRSHERCTACGILLGRGHEESGVDGYCDSCYEWQKNEGGERTNVFR